MATKVTASQVVAKAISQIGVKESPKNSNKVKYNVAYYGSNTAAPWCATFVWWVFKECGDTSILPLGKKSAYCPDIGDYIIASGRRKSKSSGKPGDVVLFDFNGNGTSDHIGIIEKKNSDGSYTCIEGNTSLSSNANGGQVMRRKRYQSQVNHIYRPPYAAESTTTATSSSSSKTTSSSKSSSKLSVDGSWGKNTTKKSQKILGTVQDGIVSNQWKSCKKYLPNCSTDSWKFGSSNKKGSAMVKSLQKLVGVSRDGIMGKGTVKALQKFLKKKGYYSGSIDGKCGPGTVKAWQKYINSKL